MNRAVLTGHPAPTFAQHLNTRLARYRRGISFAVALIVGITFGAGYLGSQMRSDAQLLRAISAHVADLVESQDRPDLQRLLGSIVQEKEGRIRVIQHGQVVASSGDLTELDRPFTPSGTLTLPWNRRISWSGLWTEIPVERPGGSTGLRASLLLVTPLERPLLIFSALTLFFLGLALAAGHLIAGRLRRAMTGMLAPVRELDQAIRALRTLHDPDGLKPTGIAELENIRTAILETHQALTNARDALAEAKAKELAAEAYRRLIHDLHNPVRCLGNLIKLAANPPLYGQEEARDAAAKIPAIAEQILLQVDAAKSNLNFESTILKLQDLRACVREAAEQARLSSARFAEVAVEIETPPSPVIAAHDEKLLKRAIGNLVKNALDACRARVQVAVFQSASEVQIRVIDDGPGLIQEEVGLYLQGRKRSTKEDRPAVGLAAANHIVRSHGGRIVYRASELGGACFEIRI